MKLLLTSAGLRNESLRKALKKLVNEEGIRFAFIPTAANMQEGEKDWLIADYVKVFGLKPHPLGCEHFEHPKIEHQFKPHSLECGGASIF